MPTLTCTCILIADPSLDRYLGTALADFSAQGYPARLVICRPGIRETVDRHLAAYEPAFHSRVTVLEFAHNTPPGVMISRAMITVPAGSFALWPADARHHPDRLSQQVGALDSEHVASCLGDQMVHMPTDGVVYWVDYRRGQLTSCSGDPTSLAWRRGPEQPGTARKSLRDAAVDLYHELVRSGQVHTLRDRGYLMIQTAHGRGVDSITTLRARARTRARDISELRPLLPTAARELDHLGGILPVRIASFQGDIALPTVEI